ncbi:TonB-dependent receptor domain-containing protein [Pseudoduganella namucuonensis]|nr:TonB-dependent receptor [Pseudoduganella namucuonensis]
MQKVEVTGSRIPTANIEGTSPVTVLGAKDIKTDGVRNVESLLNNLPQVFADQGGNVVNGSTGTATVNLRGLGAERTLVLVNGKRMPMGSPSNVAADLNQIPAPLIKRVEVLTGGAGAVYGSDAVSGVVNFIMNDRFEGVQLEANIGGFNHSQKGGSVAKLVETRGATNPSQFKLPGDKGFDGKSKDASLLVGSNFADNKGNATLFFSYKNEDALLQADRDFSACTVSSNATGFACGGSGTNATGRIASLESAGISKGKILTIADANGTARPFNNALDQYNFGPINHYQRPSERYGFNGTVHYDVNDKIRLYSDFSFHDDRTVAQIAPGGMFDGVAVLRNDNPFLSQSIKDQLGITPTTTTEVSILRRNVEGGGRQSEYRNSSYRELFGVKGEVGGWNYDIYGQSAKVIYSQSESNYFSSTRVQRALDVVNVNGVATCRSVVDGSDPACVPYNVYKLGAITPAMLAYLQIPGMRKGSTEQQIQGATIASDLGDYGIKVPGHSSGVGVSFGAEHRKEKLELMTDAATQAGDLSGSGGPTGGVVGQYSVKDVFGEMRIPLIENKPFADKLEANASYRHSSYSTGNKANTFGVGLDWAPLKEVRFRGSYQKAVRAPNLIELYTPQGNNLFDMDADPCAGDTPSASLAACQRTGVTAAQYGNIQDSPAGQYNYLQGGNTNLKPETAKSKTFGVVLTPMRNLSVTIDYFDIQVEDTIDIIDPATSLSKCLATGDARFCSLIKRDRTGSLWLFDDAKITGTQQNIGSTGTTGIDVGANYVQRIGAYGSVGFNFAGTYLRKLETEEIKGEGVYDCVGYYGPNKCEQPNPKWRHKIRANWNTPWNVDLAVTWRHIDKVQLQNLSSNPLLSGASNPVDRELGQRDYMDLSASYNITKKISLSGGINNVFDRDPPLTSQLATGQGNGNTYPSVYDALGRRLFMTMTAKF